jgi:hypothetical protein
MLYRNQEWLKTDKIELDKMLEIKILKQYFLGNQENKQSDLCSHGLILLKINDKIISDEKDDDWTISTSALQLLRTIDNTHNIDIDYPIIQHCGGIKLLGCPISINWESINKGNYINISKVHKCPTTNTKDKIGYPDAEISINKNIYVKEIMHFAEQVIDFFNGHNPIIEDEYDRNNYKLFWEELNHLYHLYK